MVVDEFEILFFLKYFFTTLNINVTFFNNSIMLTKHYYVDTSLNINVTFLTTLNINVKGNQKKKSM